MADCRRQITIETQDLLYERDVHGAWHRRTNQEGRAFIKQRRGDFQVAADERRGLLASDVKDLLIRSYLGAARGIVGIGNAQ